MRSIVTLFVTDYIQASRKNDRENWHRRPGPFKNRETRRALILNKIATALFHLIVNRPIFYYRFNLCKRCNDGCSVKLLYLYLCLGLRSCNTLDQSSSLASIHRTFSLNKTNGGTLDGQMIINQLRYPNRNNKVLFLCIDIYILRRYIHLFVSQDHFPRTRVENKCGFILGVKSVLLICKAALWVRSGLFARLFSGINRFRKDR